VLDDDNDMIHCQSVIAQHSENFGIGDQTIALFVIFTCATQ